MVCFRIYCPISNGDKPCLPAWVCYQIHMVYRVVTGTIPQGACNEVPHDPATLRPGMAISHDFPDQKNIKPMIYPVNAWNNPTIIPIYTHLNPSFIHETIPLFVIDSSEFLVQSHPEPGDTHPPWRNWHNGGSLRKPQELELYLVASWSPGKKPGRLQWGKIINWCRVSSIHKYGICNISPSYFYETAIYNTVPWLFQMIPWCNVQLGHCTIPWWLVKKKTHLLNHWSSYKAHISQIWDSAPSQFLFSGNWT